MEEVEEFKSKKDKNKEEKPKFVARTTTDVQRIKLEKLMKNPQKEVAIPNFSSKKDGSNAFCETPSFVRNVMGSSAGAGSGEFHVYRHLRRKEYARQKTIQQQSIQEQMDEEFRNKLEQNRLLAEQKTAKKRAKRLKKKKRAKQRKPNNAGACANASANESHSQSSESSENESDTEADKKRETNEESKSDSKVEEQQEN